MSEVSLDGVCNLEKPSDAQYSAAEHSIAELSTPELSKADRSAFVTIIENAWSPEFIESRKAAGSRSPAEFVAGKEAYAKLEDSLRAEQPDKLMKNACSVLDEIHGMGGCLKVQSRVWEMVSEIAPEDPFEEAVKGLIGIAAFSKQLEVDPMALFSLERKQQCYQESGQIKPEDFLSVKTMGETKKALDASSLVPDTLNRYILEFRKRTTILLSPPDQEA